MQKTRKKEQINEIVIHHTASPVVGYKNVQSCLTWINEAHKKRFGKEGQAKTGYKPYQDIAYHYLITPDNRILNTRKDTIVGWHAGGRRGQITNLHAIAVCVVGNFENDVPTKETLNLLKRTILALRKKYPMIQTVSAHRSHKATLCPGKNLVNALPDVVDGAQVILKT